MTSALQNQNAVRHGAHSAAQIVPIARAQKRRLLRQIGLKASDLESVGRGYLDNWSRAQSKVEILDRYFAAEGFLDAEGVPRPATKVYFVAVNSARLALARLEEHLRVRSRSPRAALQSYLEAEYEEAE
jgi:hypothetical protein